MLEHLNREPRKPRRAVVIGAAGFVGGAVARRLETQGVNVLALSRKEIDFGAAGAEIKLAGLLELDDVVISAAARAPCKTPAMLVENMVMAAAMVNALAQSAVSHVINISSDAVYADSPRPLNEESCAEPGTLHGAMHLSRELMFRTEVKAPLAILRPSLLYGAADPHNGYGPNRFRRLAQEGKEIALFGEGEERRDHVHIDDLAELVARVVWHRSVGTLNIATGEVHSFREIAERISGGKVPVKSTPRSGPMPHNGYRPFDIAACRKAFPDFRYTPMEVGLRRSAEAEAR